VTFDLSLFSPNNNSSNNNNNNSPSNSSKNSSNNTTNNSSSKSSNNSSYSIEKDCNNNNWNSKQTSKIYDLSTVVALEGTALETLQTYFRVSGNGKEECWYKNAGFMCEEVSKERVVEGNFYDDNAERRVHPRLLVYTRRDLPQVLDRTTLLVSRAGQMRTLGDVAFAVAMTNENYSEARRCYEEVSLILVIGSMFGLR
jgi:hypothetical protein